MQVKACNRLQGSIQVLQSFSWVWQDTESWQGYHSKKAKGPSLLCREWPECPEALAVQNLSAKAKWLACCSLRGDGLRPFFNCKAAHTGLTYCSHHAGCGRIQKYWEFYHRQMKGAFMASDGVAGSHGLAKLINQRKLADVLLLGCGRMSY